jgi:hypothetical protein
MAAQYFSNLTPKSEFLEYESIYELGQLIYGGFFFENDYKVRDSDIKAGARLASVELIQKVKPAEESHAEMMETAKKATTAEPAEKKPTVLCFSCESYNCKHPACAQKEEVPKTECEIYLPTRYQNHTTQRCPFCNGLTIGVGDRDYEWKDVDVVDIANRVSSYSLFDFDIPDLRDGTYTAHGQCVLDQLIKTKRLSGTCGTCQNTECNLIHILEERPLLHVDVKECDSEFLERVDLKKVNKWAEEEYARRVKVFLAEREKNNKANAEKAGGSA